MSSPPVAPSHDAQQRSDFQARLEFGIKFGALFFGLVYALGFLIIAIHHSTLSIPEFDPLKPKIFSAGIVFILLVGLPVLAALRTFDIFGLGVPAFRGIQVLPSNEAALKAQTVFFFWFGAYLFSVTVGQIFVDVFGPWRPWGFTYETAIFAVGAVYIVLFRKHFNRFPDTFAFAALVIVVVDVVVTFKFADRKLFWLTVWAYFIGLGGAYCARLLNDPDKRRKIQWELLIPYVALTIGLYSDFFYRYIPPHYGGGKPTPSTVYFSLKVPFTNAESANVQFLEETTSGYYILAPGDEKHAYFLRRDLVSVIHFGVPDTK
ncbi:MAG: hypothetical protein WAN65_27980 [Candidatus Sulfotelmatobacter sp.]